MVKCPYCKDILYGSSCGCDGEKEIAALRAEVERLTAENANRWINPNDKTQRQYLPHIAEKCLFAHGGRTYYGHHTGGSFQSGAGATAKNFGTWECVWMPLPPPPTTEGEEG